jgi:hypothetical protein
MSSTPDFDRIARTWLQDGPVSISDRSLQAALDEVHATPQRRFGAARRAIPLNGYALKLAAAAVAGLVVIAAIGAYSAFGPTGNVGGTPVATPGATPIATPSPSPTPIPVSAMVAGTAGAYVIDRTFDIEGITFTIGDGWNFEGQETNHVDLAILETNTSPAWLKFAIVDEVYPDPCGAPGVPTASTLGPSVDDLVTALTNLEGYKSSPVSDVTIGGLPARSFVLTDAADTTCQGGTLIELADTIDTNLNSIMRFVVLDVDGQRLLIQNMVLQASAEEKQPVEYVTTVDEVIDTITFQ